MRYGRGRRLIMLVAVPLVVAAALVPAATAGPVAGVRVAVDGLSWAGSGQPARWSQLAPVDSGVLGARPSKQLRRPQATEKLPPLFARQLAAPGQSEQPVRVLLTLVDDQTVPRFPELVAADARASATARVRAKALVEQLTAARAPGYRRLAAQLSASGGRVLDTYWLINGVVAELPRRAVAALAASAEVRYVQPALAGEAPPEDDYQPPGSPPTLRDSRELMSTDLYLSAGFDGDRVGLIDTGVSPTHTLLSAPSRLVGLHDLTSTVPLPFDQCNHGTSSASVITGNGNLGQSHRGVSAAAVNSYQVYRRLPGTTPEGHPACALDTAAAVRAFEHAVGVSLDKIIVCNTQSLAGENSALSIAADNAFSAGAVVVAANGNFGPDAATVRAPANARKVLGIGAFTAESSYQYQIPSYSSRGPTADGRVKPDLLAPSHVLAAGGMASSTRFFTGTSAATPHAGAAAAILRSYLRGSAADIAPGHVYAGMLLAGRQRWPNVDNVQGAGKLRLPQGGTYLRTTVSVRNDTWVDVPFTVPAGSCRLGVALWWPDPYWGHNDLDLQLLGPDKITAAASYSGAGVFETAGTDAPAAGSWKARVSGYSVNEPYFTAAAQTAYLAVSSSSVC